ncbi:MAG: amino acid ABC transporter permease [Rhodobacteraceae bacterium]|nr:amino acid ABC transporter permease [Paracoccaceae bacterium]
MIEIIREYWLLLLIGQYPHGPLGGLAGTMILALLCLVLAFPVSLMLALGRLSAHRLFRGPAMVISYVMRGTPFIMVIFWSYYIVPLIIGRPVSAFWVMVVALVLYESAYLGEVIRAGIVALPRGQSEAAQALGFSRGRTMRLIVLPQALFNAFPAIVSQFVSIIKETSLGVVIGVHEFTYAANQVNGIELVKPVAVYSILAITFFILCFSFTSAARWLEARVTAQRTEQLA